MYPNPTTGILQIEFETVIPREVILTDVSGKQCYIGKSNRTIKTLDISQFTAGWYILRIEEKNTIVKEFKVIKK